MSIYSLERVTIWNYGLPGHIQVPPCHSVQAERDTESRTTFTGFIKFWIPAFAGMTALMVF